MNKKTTKIQRNAKQQHNSEQALETLQGFTGLVAVTPIQS